ncbi:dna polymerase i [Nannochloropsis oceanica]
MGGLAFVFRPTNRCSIRVIRQLGGRQSLERSKSVSFPAPLCAISTACGSSSITAGSSSDGRGGRSSRSSRLGGGSSKMPFMRPLNSVVEGRGERIKMARGDDDRDSGAASAAPVVVDAVQNSGIVPATATVDSILRPPPPPAPAAGDKDEDGVVGAGGEGAPDLSAELARLEELGQDIFKMAGREFKITSYVELSRVLFEDLSLPVVKQPSNKVLGGYYSTSNAVLNELSAMGYELPAKVLDYRALLYLIRSKQGKKKKKKTAGERKDSAGSDKDVAGGGAGGVGGAKGERMSPEEKLMMSMLKEESGIDALDRTMVRVGVDISKVMERVQTMTNGGGLRTPGGASTEEKDETFIPEEGGFEEPDLAEPIPMLMGTGEEDLEGEKPMSLYDKGWGVANNFVLIDAASIIYRTFHAMPKLTGPDGTPINAVLGFCNVLNKLLLPAMVQSRIRPYVLVVFDGHVPLHRQTALYPTYKANRARTPEDLISQFPLAQEAAIAFGAINVTAPDGLEADDVIATFAQVAIEQVPDMKVTIVSSDKDFLQLVGDDVSVFDPFNMARLGPNEVFEKYGLEAGQLLDYFAMVGDAADNVPGIPGIGPKTAQELLEEFESFEELWEFKDEVESPRLRKIVEDNVEKFLMSRRLIRLKKLFEPPSMTLMPRARFSEAKMQAFCAKYGFKTLASRVTSTLAKAEAAKEAAAEEGGVGRGFFS